MRRAHFASTLLSFYHGHSPAGAAAAVPDRVPVPWLGLRPSSESLPVRIGRARHSLAHLELWRLKKASNKYETTFPKTLFISFSQCDALPVLHTHTPTAEECSWRSHKCAHMRVWRLGNASQLLAWLGGVNPHRHNRSCCDGKVQQLYTEPSISKRLGGMLGAAPALSTQAANSPKLLWINTSAFTHSYNKATALIN